MFSGTVTARPGRGLKGETRVPGDKSISHRSVFFGSLAEGETVIEGFLEGEDNFSTLKAFGAMGIDYRREGSAFIVKGAGIGGLKEPQDVIDAGNSGTTTRLLMGLLSAQPFFSVVTGDASLRKRPMKRVVTPLLKMGASISGRMENSLLPVAISGRPLNGIYYKTPVASAQLKSAILLAGLFAEGETVVEEPEKSRDHTERMLKLFGADIEVDGLKTRVRKSRRLAGLQVRVPGDISSAAFLMVGAMITPESELLIRDVGVNPTRTGIIDVLRKMGGDISIQNEREVSGEPVADMLVRSSRLKGADISGSELLPAIDEFPIICVAAAFAEGVTTITGASELRVKESDRIAVMSASLSAIGIKNTELPDGIRIEGRAGGHAKGGRVQSHGDHRIAMSMAMAALNTEEGVEIGGASSVDVSFPGFFKRLEEVAAR